MLYRDYIGIICPLFPIYNQDGEAAEAVRFLREVSQCYALGCGS